MAIIIPPTSYPVNTRDHPQYVQEQMLITRLLRKTSFSVHILRSWLVIDFILLLREVETVKVHNFVPHRYEVAQELLLGVLTCVDFRKSAELGV